MIRILGINRFPVRVFGSCIALALAATMVPRWLIPLVVFGGALWIASFAVRDEMRLVQREMWERRR